jgi:hypothetical protein
LVYPRTVYTDVNSLWLLAEWHEVRGCLKRVPNAPSV